MLKYCPFSKPSEGQRHDKGIEFMGAHTHQRSTSRTWGQDISLLDPTLGLGAQGGLRLEAGPLHDLGTHVGGKPFPHPGSVALVIIVVGFFGGWKGGAPRGTH